MTAATAAERQRRHRHRVRSERAASWRADYPSRWHALLDAWAGRGLQMPPTDRQLQMLTPYTERPRGPRQLGTVLSRVKRATYRHSPTTYRLVGALLRGLEQLRQLMADSQDAFDRPLPLDDPNGRRERGEDAAGAERAPPRRSKQASSGQLPIPGGSFSEQLRRAGLDPKLADRLERRDRNG